MARHPWPQLVSAVKPVWLSPAQRAALHFLHKTALGALAPGSNLSALVSASFDGVEFLGTDLDTLMHAGLAQAEPQPAHYELGTSPIDPEPGIISVTHLWQITPAGRLAIASIKEQD